MRRQSGFTLMELLIVIAIIGILAGIAVPNFLSYLPKYRLKAAVDDLFTNLQLAKMTAVRNATDCTVNFTSTGYTIESEGQTIRSVNLADYGSGIAFISQDGGSGLPSGPMVFNSRGFLNPPSKKVHLTNSQRTRYYVISVLTSGVIEIE